MPLHLVSQTAFPKDREGSLAGLRAPEEVRPRLLARGAEFDTSKDGGGGCL